MSTPIDIEHDTERNRLTITWDDRVVSRYPIPYLRGWCPCAGCQGHSDLVRFQPSADAEVRATRISEVGAYAIGLSFSDSHDSGIYTWDWLWKIAAECEPRGYKQGSFAAGRYSED